MRTLLILFFCIGTISLSAQLTTTTTTHRTNTNSLVSSNGKTASRSSISRSASAYKFSADFKARKQEDIREALLRHLSDENLSLKNGNYTWQLENADGIYFNCQLTEGTLSLNLDKTIAPFGSLRKTEALCDDLVAIISSHPNMPYQSYDPQLSHQRSSKSNSTELQQALRELEAARRKVERLGKKVEDERKN